MTGLVKATPTELAVDPGVYEGLQRLACEVETVIFAVDQVRHSAAGHLTEPRL